MGKRDFIQITIKPKNLSKRIDKFRNKTKSEYRNLLSKMAESTAITMKAFAPSRTGRLRASIRIKSKHIGLGSLDLRSNILIGPTVRYASYVDQGTASSPGRFVPFLGRRLITERPDFGRHPGITPSHFIDRTKDKMDSDFRGKGENFVRSIIRTWNRLI